MMENLFLGKRNKSISFEISSDFVTLEGLIYEMSTERNLDSLGIIQFSETPYPTSNDQTVCKYSIVITCKDDTYDNTINFLSHKFELIDNSR